MRTGGTFIDLSTSRLRGDVDTAQNRGTEYSTCLLCSFCRGPVPPLGIQLCSSHFALFHWLNQSIGVSDADKIGRMPKTAPKLYTSCLYAYKA